MGSALPYRALPGLLKSSGGGGISWNPGAVVDYLTIGQLNELFQRLTMVMLGLDTSLEASAKAVRLSWPTGGAPAWKVSEDVCFLQIIETDDRYNRQRDVSDENIDAASNKQTTSYTRVIGISWTFYGPSSFSNAMTVRDCMFYQNFRDVLAQNNIYLIPDIISPRRAPESFQGQWWERVDMNINFNEKISRELTVSSLADVPVTIMSKDLSMDIDIV